MEKKLKYDFSGWATRNDLACSDGRTIRRDAFAHCDGKTVPLVWNHQHDDPTNILGHALLENREDGVYAYCTFNETAAGKAAKLIVQHGDVDSLSIYANGLKQQGGNVMHGDIKELSLVVAGANPGAFIDFVDLAHGEGAEQEVIFCANEPITLAHADEGKADDSADDGKKSADGDKKDTGDGDTVEDVINSLTEKQKTVVVALLANAMAHSDDGEEKKDDGHIEHSEKSEGGDKTMKRNVFEKPEDNQATTLSHSAQTEIIASAKLKSVGTLQGAMKLYAEQHNDTLKHGIDDIEALFPEYTMTDGSKYNIAVYNGLNGTGTGDVLGIHFDLVLPASGWSNGSITVAESRLVAAAKYKYLIDAYEASREEYLECNVRPKDISTTGFITFVNDTDPIKDITVNIVRLELSVNAEEGGE